MSLSARRHSFNAILNPASQLGMVLEIDGFMSTGKKIFCTKLFLTISSLLTGHALGHGEEFVKWSASSICSCPQALRKYTESHAYQIAGEYVVLQSFLNVQERKSVMAVAKSAASGKVGLVSQLYHRFPGIQHAFCNQS